MEVLETLKRKSLLLLFYEWYFIQVPKKIFLLFKNLLKFGNYFFSITLLLKTYFSHWHGYRWVYNVRGIDIWKFFEVYFSNLISRILGAFIRTFVILFGILFELAVLILGPIVLISWIFLPLISLIAFLYGFKSLF
jgi:hypothetical protein